ncbi:MAG: cell envelope integrity protein TolA [Propionivibrio sp.]|nr:cell envelope integrity protein TolA [Propionivibrio sp.]MBP6710701.1 cell envelope integrity protein TolA [Propionivibrio sp.]MBP7524002.1 cell envelope integrity protein TolA [Propionivibrio sp.]
MPPSDDDSTDITSIVLSALVHGALLAALFFGVQWKSEQAGGIPVDVYYGNPNAVVAPPPPPEPEPKPEPAPKVEPSPPPKPEVKVEEKPQIDPQIAIRDKEKREREEKERLEKERLEQEKLEKLKKQKELEEKEKARKDEAEKKAREKKEADERRAEELRKEAEREHKQAQQKRVDAARTAQMDAINAELEGVRGSPTGSKTGTSSGAQSAGGNASNLGQSEYMDQIRRKIRGNIVLPSGIVGNPEAQFAVTQLPTGEILPPVVIKKSSGNKALDEAVERAILKSSPLPKPKNPKDFERTLGISYKPFDE